MTPSTPLTLAAAISAYLAAARSDALLPALAAPLAKTSLKSYGSWLNRLARYLGPEAGVTDFTETNLRRHLLDLEKKELAPATRRGAIMAWRALGRWLVATRRIEANPAEKLRPPPVGRQSRDRCTASMLEKAFDSCDLLADPRRGVMAKAIHVVMAFGLLRRAELLSLRVKDVDEAELAIHFTGKGGKDRTTVLSAENFAYVRAWLKVRGPCRHEYLWAGYDNTRRLGDEGLRTLLLEVRAAAGYRDTRGLLPHGIRHCGASMLHKNGAELQAVKEMLGHASIATTAIYLHCEEERLREVAELAGFVHSDQRQRREVKKDTSEWRKAAWRRGRRE